MIIEKLKNKSDGFTLIETMIAITVLLMVVTGPIVLAAQSLRTASYSKNNLIAVNLAQEGIELVRFYRTNNVLQGKDWMQDLMPPGVSEHCNSHICSIDARDFTLEHCDGNNCSPFLHVDPVTGIYNYSTGPASIFKREISLSTLPGLDYAVRVSVTIRWEERFGSQSFTVEQIMTNWILP